MVALSSCSHDEPRATIKPAEERTVLVLSADGHIYDHTGALVMELPNCSYAAEIIADGDDYFVSGVHAKGRVGYWKNGKWNTLHVDFIDDVDHWTNGIGKWDYYIYLLDLPNVLKNSGIFPLEDYHNFIAATHALAVSEGKCYVVGYELSDEEPVYAPVLYTNFKKENLPLPAGARTGECHAIYAHDRDHTLVGGTVDGNPALWVDKEYRPCELTFPSLELEEGTPRGSVEAVTMCNGRIYAAGYERDNEGRLVATVWVDGIATHYASGNACALSRAIEIYAYGDDVYVLTYEPGEGDDEGANYLWMNGTLVMSYRAKPVTGFTVL